MIGDLKPYPAYKDSGVEWMGEIPKHWDVRSLASFGTFSKGSGGTKEDELGSGIPCVRYGDLYTTHQYHIERSRAFVAPERAAAYTSIKFGDLLFASSGETVEEIGKSAVNLIPSNACCGGDVIVFRPRREIDARYLGYATDCQPAAAQKAAMGRGFTVVHIYTRQLKRLSLALPPLPEQSAIARFLDHATVRIDRHVRAKEKLIALLEEQKRVVIQDAVTGRIDVRTGKPYPAYKPSGVEWLGDVVPDHWQILPLKRVGTFRGGTGFPISEQGRKRDEILFAKVSDMNTKENQKRIVSTTNKIAVRTAAKLGATIFNKGTIIFPKVGGGFTHKQTPRFGSTYLYR